MTYIKQPLEEGEKKTCSCGVELIGRLTDYKGRFDDKLQWQPKTEHKSHYDKDGNCKDVTASTITQKSTIENTTNSNTSAQTDIEIKNIPHFGTNTKEKISDKARNLWHIRMQVEATIQDLEDNPNGGMIWEMTKIIYDELYGDKKQ